MALQSRGHLVVSRIFVERCQSHARQGDCETVSIQIGEDAIFALIQVKYGQKAYAKHFGRASRRCSRAASDVSTVLLFYCPTFEFPKGHVWGAPQHAATEPWRGVAVSNSLIVPKPIDTITP